MIIQNIALANKRTRAILLSLAFILLHCVLAREHGSCAHSRYLPQNLQKQEIPKITTTSRIQKLEAQEMMKRSLVCSCSSLAPVRLTPLVLACILYYLSFRVISDAHGFPQSLACGEMCSHPFASVVAFATFVM